MVEISHKELLKYALGILILLAFIAILGTYLFFLSRIPLGANGAGVMLAGQSSDALDQRLSSVQSEIDQTLARVKDLEGTRAPATPVSPPASAPKYLKISNFSSSQTLVPSGRQTTFSYAAENTARGASYRLLLQCPAGVTAIYSNGSNVCRRTIAEALPIDNSGSYSVTFTNTSADPGVVIAVLLASDITDNAVFFRDSRVMTVTIMPSGYVADSSNASLTLTSTPSGAPAPATISFTATLNNIQSCYQSHWEFGDGVSSENFAICPNSFSTVRARTIFETHQYNQPGTYTATLISGDKRASNTIYVSAATALYTAPAQYTQYLPFYNYVYTPQPPVYNYNLPSLPDVPTVPTNFRAVASSGNGITLNWSAPTYGNVINYTIYRIGGSTLVTPISGSPSACGSSGAGVCYYTVNGNQIGFTDANVSAGNTYTYRIVAGNNYGSSNFSDSLTVNLAESNSPTVPRTFTATVNAARIILNWSAPSSGNVSSYTIYRKGGGGLLIPVTVSPPACGSGDLSLCYYFVSGQTFTLVDSNLAPNTAYTYRIIATNPFGTSEYSDSLTVISGQADPPVVTPALNSANRVDGIGMVQLSWNSVGANYYKIYRNTNRNDAVPANEDIISGCTVGTTNPCFLVLSGDSRLYSLQAIDNQYDVAKTYYYRVKAYGANGASNWSNEVSATPTVITLPAVIPTISFAAIPLIPHVASDTSTILMCQTTNAISLSRLRAYNTDVAGRDKRYCNYSWMDSQGGIFRYRFLCYSPNDRSTVDGTYLLGAPRNFVCEEVDGTGVPLVPPNSRSIVKNCAAGDVADPANPAACNGTGAGTVLPTRTSAPQNLRITSTLNNIYLAWDAPANGISTSYLVVRKIGNVASLQYNGLQSCIANNVDPCFMTTQGQALHDSNSLPGSSYTYVVLASNLAGLSNPSNTVFGAPQASDPVITNFTIDGQIAPTVTSGAYLTFSYAGTNISSYKLFLQCPANVSIPDQATGNNLCRTNSSDAFQIGSSPYQIAIYNMNSSNQTVNVTLIATRDNNILSNSVIRTIIVRPQQ